MKNDEIVTKAENLLKTILDPEINVNIVDLGLIYGINIKNEKILVDMTLTTPTCPYGPILIEQVQSVLSTIPEIKSVEINLTFEPPWDYSRLSEIAKEELGLN